MSTRVRRVTSLQAVTENGVSSEVSANIIFLFFSTFANKMTVVGLFTFGLQEKPQTINTRRTLSNSRTEEDARAPANGETGRRK